LQVPLLAGRAFKEADDQNGEPVVIVNETFAHRHWPGQNPIGKHVHFPEVRPDTRAVVGLVGDLKNDGLAASPHEQVFIPYTQPVSVDSYSERSPAGPLLVVPNINLLCRTLVLPVMLGEEVKRVLEQIDSAVAVSGITTMEDVLNDAISDRRFPMTLLTSFSSLALLLAAVGIYGVISFSVSQRTHEIGIRMALGARQGQVKWMIVSAALKTVLSGMAIGVGIALFSLRSISRLLFEVRYTDPGVLIIATVGLSAVGAVAALIPARRAAGVDPMVALRYE
jgi:putative ABC transport system permease protein